MYTVIYVKNGMTLTEKRNGLCYAKMLAERHNGKVFKGEELVWANAPSARAPLQRAKVLGELFTNCLQIKSLTNWLFCGIIYIEREENKMTREEKIARLIAGGQLPTFEEWYELNRVAFEYTKNKNKPRDLYEEYVAEVLGE